MKDKVFNLDIPQLEGEEGYIGTFFTMYLRLATMVSNPEFTKEPIKLAYLGEIIISTIPNDTHRQTIRDSMKETQIRLEKEFREKHNYSSDKILSHEEYDHIVIMATIYSLGNVTDFISKFLGLISENKVGFIRHTDDNGITSYKSVSGLLKSPEIIEADEINDS